MLGSELGRITLTFCVILLRLHGDVWIRSYIISCMTQILASQSLCVRLHLGNWGMYCTVGSAKCSRYMVYHSSAMTALLIKL